MKNQIPWKDIISNLKYGIETEQFILWKDNNPESFIRIRNIWNDVYTSMYQVETDTESIWKMLEERINMGSKKSSLNAQKRNTVFFRYAAVIVSILLLQIGYHLYRNIPYQDCISITNDTGKSTVVLPDSSVVILHDKTTLTSPDVFRGRLRTVDLEGEAMFDIRHVKNSKFEVNVGDLSIRVYGTRFNVKEDREESLVKISLIEGKISLRTLQEDHEVFMSPGESLIYNEIDKTMCLFEDDVEFASLWTEDLLRFEGDNLRYVCKCLEVWYGVKIEVSDDVPDTDRYTFTLKKEPLENILEIISRITPVKYEYDTGRIIISLKH